MEYYQNVNYFKIKFNISDFVFFKKIHFYLGYTVCKINFEIYDFVKFSFGTPRDI